VSDLGPELSFLRDRGFGAAAPTLALILGSGFGAIEAACEPKVRIDYVEIPGLPAPSGLPGHVCRLTQGNLWGANALVFRGRYHGYEGFTARELGLLPRLAQGLGASLLVVTNASGGIRPGLEAGNLLAITDHINLMGLNPLVGLPRISGAARFAPMAGAYDSALVDALVAAAGRAGESMQRGVYAAVLGPSFETAAEVRALAAQGADAVGMSTVPEVIVARALGMSVCGLSLITNRAGSSDDSHDRTLRQGADNAARLGRVLEQFVRGLGQPFN